MPNIAIRICRYKDASFRHSNRNRALRLHPPLLLGAQRPAEQARLSAGRSPEHLHAQPSAPADVYADYVSRRIRQLPGDRRLSADQRTSAATAAVAVLLDGRSVGEHVVYVSASAASSAHDAEEGLLKLLFIVCLYVTSE